MDAPAAPQASNGGASLALGLEQEQVQLSRSGGDRNWSARIRASIARLMEIEGHCLGHESYVKAAEKRKAREAEQAFQDRVDRLEAATKAAHKEHLDRLRDGFSASTAKKMRLTWNESLPPAVATSASRQHTNEQEALDTLAVAAVAGDIHENQFALTSEPASVKAKKPKRSSQREKTQPLDEAGRSVSTYGFAVSASATVSNPVQVHDPTLAKAIGKLSSKLSELLGQLEATSDSAVDETIIAVAAKIALEATEMRRCEQLALTRMVEIEEHRQLIMQGLLEYAKRKEQWEMDERESKSGGGVASNSQDNPSLTQDAKDANEKE
ncbi:unnamed protein product [Phytophthora fragariaefolia]|uniref:Unnamed protein product n=1 Tax=Phytophthora fragariaefolia TaxID=1490495 RepID=A0A9W7D692_9STRA|nr:unnamed protein product [Phytophthora fragariaefolia]